MSLKESIVRGDRSCSLNPRPSRVVIENVSPKIAGGRFSIRRTVGQDVLVLADIFADGHDVLAAAVLYRKSGEANWKNVGMEELGNDRWQGRFSLPEIGAYQYTVRGWIDGFSTWRRDFRKKVDAGQDISNNFLIGFQLIEEAAERASGAEAKRLRDAAASIRASQKRNLQEAIEQALEDNLKSLVARYPDPATLATYDKELTVVVDRERARFGAWYEMFPRSCSKEPRRDGTFRDCIGRLRDVAEMGFDVVYLPPIHPIGKSNRKGSNNRPAARPSDVGSPWAIGSTEGGHKAIHSQLGSLEDFRELLEAAQKLGLEVALDLAYQCSPDHPYVKEHPGWFRRRPDGTIQCAENPPKKYEDIYPLNFDTEDWRDLWEELKSIVLFWIAQGVRIFRVDNPHTKPFVFWEWLIAEVKKVHSDVLFLSEAFTRPKVMHRLAQVGFTQSYTYFAWRNTKWELTEYFTELTRPEVREYFRPNLWPNTPDILTEYLQSGGRPAFVIRLVLAATLGANYGIYGPAFELCENRAIRPGSEEYLNSEKYEVRHWDLNQPGSLAGLITQVNRIRRENHALATDGTLRFYAVDNDQLIAYSKATEDLSNIVLIVVNLDPHHPQSGWVELPLNPLGLDEYQTFQVHDLLGEARYLWQGSRNYVELDPAVMPAHIFRIRRRVRSERDFDYFT